MKIHDFDIESNIVELKDSLYVTGILRITDIYFWDILKIGVRRGENVVSLRNVRFPMLFMNISRLFRAEHV